MKRVNNTIRALAMVLLVCMLLTTVVFAAETGSAWLNVEESKAGKTTTAVIMADVAVTDGLVTITYDSDALTYKGLTVNGTKVAMHAVNADEPGTVKIAWVAPVEAEKDNNGKGKDKDKKDPWMIKVEFTGRSDAITVNGEIYTADGTAISLHTLDTSILKAAVETAKSLDKKDYTDASYKAVKDALKEAEKVLADSAATQEQIDQAAASLTAALDALESKNKPGKPEPEKPTKPEPEKPGKPEPEKPVKPEPEKPAKPGKPGKAAASETLNTIDEYNASMEAATLNASAEAEVSLLDQVVDFLTDLFGADKEGVQK